MHHRLNATHMAFNTRQTINNAFERFLAVGMAVAISIMGLGNGVWKGAQGLKLVSGRTVKINEHLYLGYSLIIVTLVQGFVTLFRFYAFRLFYCPFSQRATSLA